MFKSRFWLSATAMIVMLGFAITHVQGSQQEHTMSTEIQSTAQATLPVNDLHANKALVEQVVNVLNTGDYTVSDQIVAEDYAQHGAGRPSGRKGLQATYASYRAAFPDIKWTINQMVAEGDKVSIYTTLIGTQKAAFNGIPATNRTITINTMDIYQITGGMVAAHWDVYDQYGLLVQLGVLPKP